MKLHYILLQEGFLKVYEAIMDYADLPQINIRNESMQTPLHLSCENSHLKIAQSFSRSGADLNSIDKNGSIPLHLASRTGHKIILSWLLSRRPSKRTITLPVPSISECLNHKLKELELMIL
ncbi:hypothetical protein SteCoe_29628 [Stentor coeruleus]|uniref:Uncharacterized protein n=1 Tax=Stentor coeruleus TaxID=5963 RepID=A0A1R2B5K1_9CILI|nr:hypothetical protein SteCoe_29628 [Stentor coeruleus]